MKSRCLSTTFVAVALLIATVPPSTLAQDPFASASSSDQLPQLEAITLRLAQQDEELRQLRAQLGSLQSEPRALPPVGDRAKALPSSDIVPASALAPDSATTSEVFELRDRVNALENRLDAKAADATVPKGYEVGTDLKMSASWRNGVQFESANKDFRFHVGGTIQFDICMFDNDPDLLVSPKVGGIGPQPDSIDLRRVRLRTDGTMYEVFDWVVQFDLANFVSVPTPNVQAPASTNPSFNEIYINWGQLPLVGNFALGSFKEPIGFEHLEGDSQLPFMERSYLQDFVFGPFHGGYSPGMAFLNWTEDLSHTWGIGFFGNSDDNFGYSLGNDYAVTGRLTWAPIYDEPSGGRYVFHVGVAGSSRGADENILRLRVRGDVRSGPPGVLNPIYADTGNIGARLQNIVAAETALVYGPFSVVAEYAGTWVEDAVLPITPVPVSRGTPFFQGGYVQCGYFLTGEHEVYDRRVGTFTRVIPYENAYCVRGCNGDCKGWGAWQLLARYNAINLDDNGINGGTLDSFTFGVNWWWSPNTRVQLNYDFTSRGPVKQVAHGDINSLGIRFGYDF